MQTIDIYGRDSCSFCEDAKRFCESKGYHYRYHDVRQGDVRGELLERLKVPPRTVPVIFVGRNEIVGGFAGLSKAEETGALQQIIGGE